MMVEKEKRKSVAKSKRTPDDKIEITFRLPKDLAIDVKTKAVKEQRSYSEVVTEALQEFMAKEKKK
jgi:hypothetical protein